MADRDAALRRLRDALVLTRAAIDDLVDDKCNAHAYAAKTCILITISQLEREVAWDRGIAMMDAYDGGDL